MKLALTIVAIACSGLLAATQGTGRGDPWTRRFRLEPRELHATGRNPYFVLEPGYQLVLADRRDTLTITVLAETRVVDGIATRVVEEREEKAGAIVEISRNYYAISSRTNSVYYFGEEVDMYANGKVNSHDGAWLSGVRGARFGLMMPGIPLVGARYYQEIADKVAMDRAQILSTSELYVAPAGKYEDVLLMEETTPLEPGHKEYKQYAPGVGLVVDGSFKLVRFGQRP